MQTQSLTKLVLEHLRNKVITGELAPGQRLNENELASSLEVSRHPIREAFRVLESERLVFSIPNKGAFVTDLSAEDLLEVYQSREMIECYAVDLLKIKNITIFPQLESAIASVLNLSAPSNDDPEQYLEYHKAFVNFHVKLVEASENSRIVHFYNAIILNLARYQFKNLRAPGRLEINNNEHKTILNALEIGDYAQAKDILKSHINKRLQRTNGSLFN
ncbi:MAG: GntR family transcriptional regulator [Methanosarcinaceae archaeon]|nr:GntR family transcriptional regulator [Methanosarcinaceae archaeon]